MPQLAMWATHHPVQLTITYSYDPIDPFGDSVVTAIIKDQSGQPMSRGSVRVGGVHMDEWVEETFTAAWLCYLYGSPEDLQSTLSSVGKRWRSFEATNRALD